MITTLPLPFTSAFPEGPINLLFGVTTAPTASPPPQVSESNASSANYNIWAGPPKYSAIGTETLANTVNNNWNRLWHLGIDVDVYLEYVVPDITHSLFVQQTFVGQAFFGMGMYTYLKVRYEQWVSA